MSTLNPIVDYNPIALATKSVFLHSKLLTNLSTFFSNLFCKNIPIPAQKLLFSVGTVAVLYKVMSLVYTTYGMWKWVPPHFRNRKQVTEQKMKKKYGDCYAVVTGCTEGIGLSYAIELARRNFGVVLVARNRQKLQKRIQQIKNIIPNFRYEIVIGDFSKPEDVKNIAKQLIALSQKIDIGIVINNAGLAGEKFKKYIQEDVKLIKDVLYVNFNATYHINAAMIPILRTRKHRSAVLNLSSCTGVFVSHGNGTYSSSKMMTDIYSRTMSIQNRDKIDIISVRPFGVKTPMMNMKKGKFMITPQDCVISSLADLGHFDTTWTGFMHKVQATYFQRMSEEKRLEIYDKLFSGFK